MSTNDNAKSAANSTATHDSIPNRAWAQWALAKLAGYHGEMPQQLPEPGERPRFSGAEQTLAGQNPEFGDFDHRLAYAYIVHGIRIGAIGEDSIVISTMSILTSLSAAWFLRHIGVKFVAMVPHSMGPAKMEAIRALGGRVGQLERGALVGSRAREIATVLDAHLLGQFE